MSRDNPAEPKSSQSHDSSSTGRPSKAVISKAEAGALKSRKRSKSRRWAFRFAAVLLSLSLLPGFEVLCRGLNLGSNVDLIIPVESVNPAWTRQLNELADLPYYGATNLSGPEPRHFALARPQGTFRIVVLGASTVIGFPFAAELAFPRHIEVMLERQNPGQNFEVLNCGVTGVNSFSLADLLDQSLEASPDLVILHAGHNEFYGPGGPASTAVQLPPSLQPLGFRLRRTRSFQLFRNLRQGDALLDDELVNVLPASLDIPLKGPVFSQACQNYRTNVERMVRTCRERNVPLLLSTVACNLRSQSPLHAPWPDRNQLQQHFEWKELVTRATELIQTLDFEKALELIRQAAAIHEDHALLQYRQGECLIGLQKPDEASIAFRRAVDLDGCRFRAPSAIAEVMRDIVQKTEHSLFLDIEKQVTANAESSVPGNEFFLEHVHYNSAGTYLLGGLFAEYIQTSCLHREWSPALFPNREEVEELLGSTLEDKLTALFAAIQLLESEIFNGVPDRDRQIEALGNDIAEVWSRMSEQQQRVYGMLSPDQTQWDLIAILILLHRAHGNSELVAELTAKQKLRQPWRTMN